MQPGDNREWINAEIDSTRRDLEHLKRAFRGDFGRDLEEIAEMSRELQHADARTLVDLSTRIDAMVDRLQSLLGQLRERSPFALGTQDAIQLANEANSLQADIDLLLAALGEIEHWLQRGESGNMFADKLKPKLASTIRFVKSMLKPIVRAIHTRLWKLIAGLLTPKEWSISGEVGNTVLGLGKVRMEIKFGP